MSVGFSYRLLPEKRGGTSKNVNMWSTIRWWEAKMRGWTTQKQYIYIVQSGKMDHKIYKSHKITPQKLDEVGIYSSMMILRQSQWKMNPDPRWYPLNFLTLAIKVCQGLEAWLALAKACKIIVLFLSYIILSRMLHGAGIFTNIYPINDPVM